MQEKRSDALVQQAVKRQFLSIAPERLEDLQRIWSDNQLLFSVLADDGDAKIQSGLYREVQFTRRFLWVMWVSAFAAWEGYSAAQQSADRGAPKDLRRFKELLDLALQIRDATNYEAISLGDVPEPGTFPDATHSPQGRAASELAMWVSGWAMLHEVRHVRHQREGTSSPADASASENHKEELSCDAFATEFLLAKVGEHAKSSGEDVERVIRKRRTGIYFAMFGLAVLAYPNWSATLTHPALQDRFDATRSQVSGSEVDESLVIAFLAFSSLADVWSGSPTYSI